MQNISYYWLRFHYGNYSHFPHVIVYVQQLPQTKSWRTTKCKKSLCFEWKARSKTYHYCSYIQNSPTFGFRFLLYTTYNVFEFVEGYFTTMLPNNLLDYFAQCNNPPKIVSILNSKASLLFWICYFCLAHTWQQE